jgi:uncharacterized protein
VASTLNTEQIPDPDYCEQLFDRYEMLPNIREHSRMVALVAGTLAGDLAGALPSQVQRADRDMVIAAALLHDIAKTECIKSGGHHADLGRKICIGLGYPAIGAIVAEHVVLREFREDEYRLGTFGAKELVFYADKRVLHDQIVSLDERLTYILSRYGAGDPQKQQQIRHYFQHSKLLETYLFSYLPYGPDELLSRLGDS